MRETLRKKLTASGIAGALVLGIGAIAGAATAGGSDSPTPAGHTSVDDTTGTVPDTEVTTPTLGVTTPTLDDDAFEDGEHDDDAFEDGEHEDGEHEDGDDHSGPGGGDEDRSGPNSGPG